MSTVGISWEGNRSGIVSYAVEGTLLVLLRVGDHERVLPATWRSGYVSLGMRIRALAGGLKNQRQGWWRLDTGL